MIKHFAFIAGLAGSALAQQLPPIRQLGAVTATSTEALGAVVTVRHSANGVLVNDIQNRRLLFFDPALAQFSVVADTTPATASAYGGRAGALIAYRGDSSLFVDPASQSMTVVDPQGKMQRVMALPRSQDAMTLGNAIFGTPAFDASGRLVYRAAPDMRAMMSRAQMGPNGTFMPPEPPDTMELIRVDLASRTIDTVGFLKVPKIRMDVQRDENGRVRMQSIANPLPVVDDWAVLSDGSIALVRGRDYHVDWVRPNGTRESSAKMPFEWQRLTDEDKVAFLDSVKAARQRMIASAPAQAAGGAAGGAAAGGPPGGGQQVVIMGGPPGAGGPPPGGVAGGPGREMTFVSAAELPDYKPPFFVGSVRADADGLLWVRTIPTKAVAGGPVYDVVNAKGELVERVQIPKDRAIVGFGQGGVVYLLAREASATTSKLERAKVR
jgi:hypothetical protein